MKSCSLGSEEASKLAAYLRNPVAWDMMWAPKLCNVPRKSYSLGYEVGYPWI
jgi:hypothetical protein